MFGKLELPIYLLPEDERVKIHSLRFIHHWKDAQLVSLRVKEISCHVFIDMLDSFVNANNWINASNFWVPCFHILYITVYEIKARIYVPVVVTSRMVGKSRRESTLSTWVLNMELLYRFLFSTSKENNVLFSTSKENNGSSYWYLQGRLRHKPNGVFYYFNKIYLLKRIETETWSRCYNNKWHGYQYMYCNIQSITRYNKDK